MDSLTKPFQWEFLKEPLWRWFIFLVALSLFSVAWRGVLKELD